MKNSWAILSIACALTLGACDDHTEGAATAVVENAEPAAAQPTANTGGAQRESLTIDTARSTFGFTGAKVTGSHDGHFNQWSGTVELDPTTLENSRVQVTIQMASVQTDSERLSGHLASPDFFDVERFPTATFESTRIVAQPQGESTHTVTGNLALHGQTRAITFPARIEKTDGEVRARAEFTINRRDFQIVYPGMPDDLIRDEVVIRFDVRAPRGA